MDYKKEFRELVESIKSTITRPDGKPLRNEDIAKRLGYERSYFSTLLGTRGEVTQDHLRTLEREFAGDFNLLNEGLAPYGKGTNEYIISLQKGLSSALEQISQLQKNLDTLLRRQQVIAAMNDASLEALLFDLADRKQLDRGEVKRSVRNRAFSKIGQFEIKGIEIETYT